MNVKTLFAKFAHLALVIGMFPGCSDDGKTEFQGTASWNGTPIVDGYVEMTPTDGMGQVVGCNIVDGKFSFRTQEGEKRVSVTAKRKIGETAPTERIPTPEPIYFQFIPEKFNAATELLVTINNSDPKVNLELTGTELKKQKMSAEDRERQKAQGGGARN